MRTKEDELLYLYLFFDLIMLNFSIWIMGIFCGDFFGIGDVRLYYYVHGNIAWTVTYVYFSKRNLYLRDGFSNRFVRLTRRAFYFVGVSLILAFLSYRVRFSIYFFLSYALLIWILKIVFYWALYQYLHQARKRGKHTQHCMIFGRNDTAIRLRTLIDCNPILGYHFLGYVSDEFPEGEDVLGTFCHYQQIINNSDVQTIFVVNHCYPLIDKKSKKFLNFCSKRGIRIRFVPEADQWNKLGFNGETMMGVPLMDPIRVPLDSIWSRFWKRCFDLVFSGLVILFVLTWLIPLISLLIFLTSRGPVFFSQKRTGLNNETFTCYKFRSMQVNRNADLLQASASDCRITWVGRILRKTNLDEFPQFFNVFIGKMSVVGPRPHMLTHTEKYTELIDSYLYRHFVKPGITGWAQVSGYRGETDELWKMEKRVEYDMEYIKTWSIWFDLRIIFMTVFGKSSYNNAH